MPIQFSLGLFGARLSQKREHSEKTQGVPEYSCNDNHELAGAPHRRRRCEMQAVTGVFLSQKEAEQAIRKLRAGGLPAARITLLTLGMLSAPVLPAADAGVGTVAGSSSKDFVTLGLPEDEIFVYEDALRRGRGVVIALAEDDAAEAALRKSLHEEGAQASDAAREQWRIGLRSAEQEHYLKSGRQFGEDEKFYFLGFESALQARNRCKEFDQVASEMASALEELQRQYPGVAVEEPFARGYQRGREYYQRLCDESTTA